MQNTRHRLTLVLPLARSPWSALAQSDAVKLPDEACAQGRPAPQLDVPLGEGPAGIAPQALVPAH